MVPANSSTRSIMSPRRTASSRITAPYSRTWPGARVMPSARFSEVERMTATGVRSSCDTAATNSIWRSARRRARCDDATTQAHARTEQDQHAEAHDEVAPARGGHHLVQRARPVRDQQPPRARCPRCARAPGRSRGPAGIHALEAEVEEPHHRVRIGAARRLRPRAPHDVPRRLLADDLEVVVQPGPAGEVALRERGQDPPHDGVAVERDHGEQARTEGAPGRRPRARRPSARGRGRTGTRRGRTRRRRSGPAAASARRPARARTARLAINSSRRSRTGCSAAGHRRRRTRACSGRYRSSRSASPSTRAAKTPPTIAGWGALRRQASNRSAYSELAASGRDGQPRERARDLEVELAAHGLGAVARTRAQAGALRFAQLPRPPVLQRGQRREQDERGRHGGGEGTGGPAGGARHSENKVAPGAGAPRAFTSFCVRFTARSPLAPAPRACCQGRARRRK